MPRKVSTEKTAVKPKPKPRPKKANGYKFPEKLPSGELLKDTAKKEWVLGHSIGQGGFGEIYCASSTTSTSKSNQTHPYVVKIEPHENGPLFVEKNFYIKFGKPDDVQKWKNEKGLKILGIPTFYGSGSHEFKNDKYRFLVIQRYGADLWNLFLKNKRIFPAAAVYRCAIQIIDILHYIHDKGYVHGDIKGANLLLGLEKGTEDHIFLVDFGLSCKYFVGEFKRDPKKAHNGTIEYTSQDWHLGVPTRRGDLEILGFNLLQWLCSTLPWEKDIKNPEKVYEKKRELMSNAKSYLAKHYPQVPKVIGEYLHYVGNLKYDETPDYKYCKDLFLKELKSLPNAKGKLDFSLVNDENQTPKKGRGKRKTIEVEVSDEIDSPKSDEEVSAPKRAKSKAIKDKTNSLAPSDDASPSKRVRKPRKAKDSAPKPSWRDAPTVQGNLNNKAGEYVKKDEPVKRKRAVK